MELSNIILSIDVGTQSIRTVLFDLKGSILEIVKTEIDPYYSDKPGWAEQDPEYFWEKLSESKIYRLLPLIFLSILFLNSLNQKILQFLT